MLSIGQHRQLTPDFHDALNPRQESKLLIEYAARAGEQFVSLYYSAYDSRNRAGLIPTLYVPQSTVVWNGNPVPGSNGVADLMNGLPATKHDVQTLDAQPVGGGSNSGCKYDKAEWYRRGSVSGRKEEMLLSGRQMSGNPHGIAPRLPVLVFGQPVEEEKEGKLPLCCEQSMFLSQMANR